MQKFYAYFYMTSSTMVFRPDAWFVKNLKNYDCHEHGSMLTNLNFSKGYSSKMVMTTKS